MPFQQTLLRLTQIRFNYLNILIILFWVTIIINCDGFPLSLIFMLPIWWPGFLIASWESFKQPQVAILIHKILAGIYSIVP